MSLHLNYGDYGCKPYIIKADGNRIQLTLCLKFHYVDVIENGKKKGYAEIRTRTEKECSALARIWYERMKSIYVT